MSDDRHRLGPASAQDKGPNRGDESSSQASKRKRDVEEEFDSIVPNDGGVEDHGRQPDAKSLDRMFADRYTSKDDEYMRLKSQPLSKPPVLYPNSYR